MKPILDKHNLQPQNKPKKLTELSILNPQTLIWSLQNLTSILHPSCMELGTGDRGVCWEKRKACKQKNWSWRISIPELQKTHLQKQVEDGSFRDERKRTRGGVGGGGDIRTRSRRWAEWWACCCIMLAKDASKPSSISLYTPNPQSLLLFFFSCFLLFPGLDFLSGTYCCCCSLSLSLSAKINLEQKGKKNLYHNPHQSSGSNEKKESSSSSSSPWVLSAELQNLSANQTWNNNICSNHGM